MPEQSRLVFGKGVRRGHGVRPARRTSALSVVVCAAVAAAVSQSACAPTISGPFATTSPWRQSIPANPRIDLNSAAMIAHIQPRPRMPANLVEVAVPIYRVSADTPTQTVTCTKDWGVCPFAGWPVPIPDGATPNSGPDHSMVTIDESKATTFEFWQAAKNDDQWSTSWGAVNSLAGTGWGGVSTGSGASRLGGVIRVHEIAAGEIPHALALQTNNACPVFRPPALKSDGESDRSDCIPEGARLQLDPSLDLTELGLTRGELVVATAMQRYGGYIMDQSGASLSVIFERDKEAGPDSMGRTYSDAGFRWDYDAMENVPWNKLRVLA
jgi:hypothetical protein